MNKADPNYIGKVLPSDEHDPADGFCMVWYEMDRLKEAAKTCATIRCHLPNGAVIWERLNPEMNVTVYPAGTEIFVDLEPPSRPKTTAWVCKIGTTKGHVRLPDGADGPMRAVLKGAFKHMTGLDAEFCFSGWGGELTESERLIVEDRVSEIGDHYLFSGPGGACMSSKEIHGLTQDLATLGPEATPEDHVRAEERCNYYGGRYFVCETMTESGMKKLAAALGLRFKE